MSIKSTQVSTGHGHSPLSTSTSSGTSDPHFYHTSRTTNSSAFTMQLFTQLIVATIGVLQSQYQPVQASHAASGCGVTDGHQILSVSCKTAAGDQITWPGSSISSAGYSGQGGTPSSGCTVPAGLSWNHFKLTGIKDSSGSYGADIEGWVVAQGGEYGLRICTAVISDDTLTNCDCNSR